MIDNRCMEKNVVVTYPYHERKDVASLVEFRPVV